MIYSAKLERPGHRATGVDYAKLARLRSSLEMKRAAIDGALIVRDAQRDAHDRRRLHLELGLHAYGRSLWTSRDEADLLTLSADDQRQGRVDVRAVHECLGLRDRLARTKAAIDQMQAEYAPLAALLAACERHIEGL